VLGLMTSCCVVTNAFSHFIVTEINGKTPFMFKSTRQDPE